MKQGFDLHDYGDILELSRPPSTRPKMSMIDRGAQFSPFAALTGYDAAVEETARLTEREVILTDEAKAALDEKLQLLADHLDDLHEVAITHFVPDTKKTGGAYVVTVGILREIDPIEGCVVMMDRKRIPVERIRDIAGDLFRGDR